MANRKDDLKTRLLATFRVEAQEHLQAITANLLALDRGLPPAETSGVVAATFREVHTLKGAARSVSLMTVEALCQALESVLAQITRGDVTLGRSTLTRLQEAVDGVARLLAEGGSAVPVRDLVRRLEHVAGDAAEATEPPAAPAGRPPGPIGLPTADSIRLPVARLDALLVQAEDLLVLKLAAGERAREARALAEAVAACGGALRAPGPPGSAATTRQAADVPADIERRLRAAESAARELLDGLAADQRAVAGLVDGLQEMVRRLRMTPASTVLDLFPPMVRDLGGAQHKEVEWTARGADLEMDRKVLESVKDPLIHLVRNAIDHGIEPPGVRVQAGKPSRGRVAVTLASLEGGRAEIRIEDDGAGIDLDRVRDAAVRARLLSAEEASLVTEDQARQLVFRSGLSTSPIITDVSGHGLGLAIVQERVERLGGEVRLETQPGAGTSVRMILPVRIATFRGLLVRAAGQLFLLGIGVLERAIRVAPDALQRVEGREAVRWNGHPLFVVPLGGLLGLARGEDPPDPGGPRPCVVVRSGEERAGLLVDEVLGEQEALVKEFTAPLVRVRHIAAAGLLSTGQLALILRPPDLLRSVREGPRPPAASPGPEQEERPRIVLVVDDSITTRTMEKNLLEAAGYTARVAVDGVEAWTALRSEPVDLVVSDVDMPRMDGFELTARIRNDRKLADLPVVLVTALESREDRERGIDVGANAYIVKSSFDQSNLLEIIRRLC